MTHEKLQALKDQLERINPKSDPLVYRRQEQLIRQALTYLKYVFPVYALRQIRDYQRDT